MASKPDYAIFKAGYKDEDGEALYYVHGTSSAKMHGPFSANQIKYRQRDYGIPDNYVYNRESSDEDYKSGGILYPHDD